MYVHTFVSHQIVNDDIEAIETTIPKLEAFYTTYDVISNSVTASEERLRSFNTSTTTSDGVTEKRAGLKVNVFLLTCSNFITLLLHIG